MFRLCSVLCILALQLTPTGAQAEFPGYEGETKQVIDHALELYRSAKTYQDSVSVQKAILREGVDVPEPLGPAMTIECAFALPNELALQSPFLSVYCDGRKYWEYEQAARQYTERDAPAALEVDRMDLGMLMLRRSHPIVALITARERQAQDVLAFVKETTGLKAENLDGQPGKRLAGRLEMKYLPIADKVIPFDAWFSDATGLLEEARLDLTAVVREVEPGGGMADKDRFVFLLRFRDIHLNASVPPERFTFAPQAGDKLTQAMEAPLTPAQQTLLGKPAPEIACKDIDGKMAGLGQQKNKVVLLYFWSTTCRECIHQLPEMQRIADAYAGKQASVVAINSDDEPSRARVSSFLKELDVTLPQWLDPTGDIGKQYGLAVMPQAVLIDPTGIVRAIYPGQIPVAELPQQIDRLLPHAK